MKSLYARIEDLEHGQGVGVDVETKRLAALSDYELLAEVARLLGADPSTLSKTVQEAFSKGYECWLAELAHLLGVELAELKKAMQGKTALTEAARCRWPLWARATQLPPPTSEELDKELETLLHDFTDAEVARLAACIRLEGGLKVSEADFDATWFELCAARDKRLRVEAL